MTHSARMPAALLLAFIFLSVKVSAQAEFPKGWALYLETSHGMATNFKWAPDRYTGALDLKPMYTVVPSHLRIGVTTGVNYTNNVLNGSIGPLIVYKLLNLSAGTLGTIGNLQIEADARWGGSNHSLIGGGPFIDLFRTLRLGVTAHRDYGDDRWWFQCAIGYNLIH